MTLEHLIDRQEIDDLLTRYATSVDTKDWDLYETCFTEDAFIDYESAGGIKGKRPEVRAWLEKVMVIFPMTQHVVCNRVIEIDGDKATARSVFYNPMALPGEGKAQSLFIDGGYYNDQLVRTADGWRITERIEESSYSTRRSQILPPAKQGEGEN
ncbi:MAG: nuclear transport factor 2 family protein [Myxococcales bacterium]|nr:nuclear transport factor 2 family protein [Myxococcales bacterium]